MTTLEHSEGMQEGIVEQVHRKRDVWKKLVEEQVGSITEIW